GNRQSPKETPRPFNLPNTISQPPKHITNPQQFPHSQPHTLLSTPPKTNPSIPTFPQTKSPYYYSSLIPHPSSPSITQPIHQLIHTFSQSPVNTITLHPGKQFSSYKHIQSQFNVHIYFPHPYSPPQTPTNQNSNPLLTQFFPKTTHLPKLTQQQLHYPFNPINHTPTNSLNSHT
ncbi:IS30 family transposase, partial [Staphylococcus pettenkoferi]|uniref:IS30 family transposase n=1 Tax=Staphylococcus pettenkoferi TaxID=170573 RepID=UPI0011A24821